MQVTRDRFEPVVRRVGAVLVAVALVATVAVVGGGVSGAVAVDGGVQPAEGGVATDGPNDVDRDEITLVDSSSLDNVSVQPAGSGTSGEGPNKIEDD